jgi:glucose/mannose-6-phosphate isomerase
LRDLDDLDSLERFDSLDVLGTMEAFPAQCREAWAIGTSASGLPEADGIDSVVVLGMGGSGAGGDVLQTVVEPRLPVPLRVIKGYGPLPEWIGRNSLVIAISYSGNTDETLATLTESHERGARLVTISSGGRMEELSRQFGTAHITIPGGLQPRAALGYVALPAVAAMTGMGLVPDLSDDVAETVEVLAEVAERCYRKRPAGENPGKELAGKLENLVPVIYGADGVGAAAARRFKSDLNETAKVPAFWNVLPELDHNELVSWSHPAPDFVIVMIVDSGDDDTMIERWRITRSLIEENVGDIVEIRTDGVSVLTRLMSTLLLGQITAIYLAIAMGRDPGVVPILDEMKSRLADYLGEGMTDDGGR